MKRHRHEREVIPIRWRRALREIGQCLVAFVGSGRVPLAWRKPTQRAYIENGIEGREWNM